MSGTTYIIPNFKKNPGNYGPVNLTSVPGEIKYEIFETWSLLKDSQYGFTKGRSRLKKLLRVFFTV